MTTKGATILEVSGDGLVGSESEHMKGLKKKIWSELIFKMNKHTVQYMMLQSLILTFTILLTDTGVSTNWTFASY